MKQNKTISLDIEIIEALDAVDNGSKLINELLMDYFGSTKGVELNKLKKKAELLEGEIKDKSLMLEEIKKRIIILEKEKEKLDKVLEALPKEIIEDFNIFKNMTEEILHKRFKEYYIDKYTDLDFKKVLSSYKAFQKSLTNEQ